jgi:hypothetical protein
MARPKGILVLLLATVALLVVTFYSRQQPGGTSSGLPEVLPAEVTAETNAASQEVLATITEAQGDNNRSAGQMAGHRSSVVSISERPTAEDEEVERIVKEKFEQLQELATKSDPDSMEAILAQMKSPYPEVRSDALEAIIQFRSRDAIPSLKEFATQAEDPKEKLAILEAVEFLQLPTLNELLTELEKAKSRDHNDTK